jgi:hypothetical protein
MGQWEVEDQEELTEILDKIDNFINFPNKKPQYDTIMLNDDINNLPPYDLYWRIQWLLDNLGHTSEIYQTMDSSGYKRYSEVINTLESIQSNVPNTRTPTPADELISGFKGLNIDDDTVFKSIDSNDSAETNTRKGGRRRTKRRRVRKLRKRRTKKRTNGKRRK